MQGEGVGACIKHFAANNQEYNRLRVDTLVDERTLREIYLPPFEGAVEAGVGSVMCSYNKINGVYSCENNETLGMLKRDLGFEGFVLSDWGAVHSASILAGLDMEMPGGAKMTGTPDAKGICRQDLCRLLKNGTVTVRDVDASVLRILTVMFRMGIFDRKTPSTCNITANVTSEAHAAVARRLATASVVMLKNQDNLLPLSPGRNLSLALIGFAAKTPPTAGGGSGGVQASHVVSPLEAVFARMGKNATRASCDANPLVNKAIPGHDLLEAPAKGVNISHCCQLCRETPLCAAYCYYGGGDGSCYLKSQNGPLRDMHGYTTRRLSASVVFEDGSDISGAATAAASADVAIVFASTKSGEGQDRKTLSLYDGWNSDPSTYSYDKLIANVTHACAASGTKV